MRKPFIHAYGPGWYWFRIFGIGLTFKNTNMYGKTFSERSGLRKSIQIGNWNVKFLYKIEKL